MSSTAAAHPLHTTVTGVFHVKGPRTVVVVAYAHEIAVRVGMTLHQGERSWTVVGFASACGGPHAEVGLVVRGDGDPSLGRVDFQDTDP
jgi:hypothetical protein